MNYQNKHRLYPAYTHINLKKESFKSKLQRWYDNAIKFTIAVLALYGFLDILLRSNGL